MAAVGLAAGCVNVGSQRGNRAAPLPTCFEGGSREQEGPICNLLHGTPSGSPLPALDPISAPPRIVSFACFLRSPAPFWLEKAGALGRDRMRDEGSVLPTAVR